MSIPLSILLVMCALRFLMLEQHGSGSYFGSGGVNIPAHEIDLRQSAGSNLAEAEKELEDRHLKKKVNQPPLVHLNFGPGVSGARSELAASAGPEKSTDDAAKKNYRLPGLLEHAAGNLADNKGAAKVQAKMRSSSGNEGVQPGSSPVHAIHPGSTREAETSTPSLFNEYSSEGGKSRENGAGQGPEKTTSSQVETTVTAVILGDQEVHEGSLVRFRTTQALRLNGISYARNTIFSGNAIIRSEDIVFNVHHLGEGAQAVRVNMHCRADPVSGIAVQEKNSILGDEVSDAKNAAVDELSSSVPVGSSVISRTGHALFHQNKKRTAVLVDGQEVEFIIDQKE